MLETVLQCLGRAIEQQVRFIEEQRQHRFVCITALRQLLEQLGQQPQQEGGIDLGGLVHQPAGIEQMDAPSPITVGAQHIFKLQRRLTKQRLGTLLFQGREAAQQGLGRGRGHQRAVFAEQLRVVLEVCQ
ncbi:hypothetical protein D3C76_867360 [compost metagenome]